MSPVDSQGKYQMNPQMSRAMDTPPVAAPAAGAEPDQITLTKQPDGSWMCDDGSGEPSEHASLAEALDYAQQSYGGDQEEMNEMGEGEDTGQSSEELNG